MKKKIGMKKEKRKRKEWSSIVIRSYRNPTNALSVLVFSKTRLSRLVYDITKLLSAILATSSIRMQCLSSRGHGFGGLETNR